VFTSGIKTGLEKFVDKEHGFEEKYSL